MRKILFAIAAVVVITAAFNNTSHSLEAFANEVSSPQRLYPTRPTSVEPTRAQIAQIAQAIQANEVSNVLGESTQADETDETTSSDTEESTTESTSMKSEDSQERIQHNRCELVTKYATHTQENYKNNYTTVTNRILDKLDVIVAGLTERGIDTSTLETNVAVFTEKAQTCGDAVGLLASRADTAKQNVCTDVNALKTELVQIKQARAARFEACKEMKDYYREQVKPVIQDLRGQLQGLATQSVSNESNVQGAYSARPSSTPEPTYEQTQNIINQLQ
jgi:hypothetical protein